jgi:hypothetical protein
MLFLLLLLVQLLAQAQDAELLLLLRRHAVLQAKLRLPKHAAFVLRGMLQPSELRLQDTLQQLPCSRLPAAARTAPAPAPAPAALATAPGPRVPDAALAAWVP